MRPDAEQVHVIIGDIPFLGEVVPAVGLPDRLSCVQLMETIGDSQDFADDELLGYFAHGTPLIVRWEDQAHPVTRLRQCRLAMIPVEQS